MMLADDGTSLMQDCSSLLGCGVHVAGTLGCLCRATGAAQSCSEVSAFSLDAPIAAQPLSALAVQTPSAGEIGQHLETVHPWCS